MARNNDILKKLVLEAKKEYEKDAEHRVHIFMADTCVFSIYRLGLLKNICLTQHLWVLALEWCPPEAADELNRPSARCQRHAPGGLQRLFVLRRVVSIARSVTELLFFLFP